MGTGAILYRFLSIFRKLGLRLIYQLILITIAIFHTIIFFTFCKVDQLANGNYHKHHRESLSKIMIKDFVNTSYHLIRLNYKFFLKLLTSIAYHYIKDTHLHNHKKRHNNTSQNKKLQHTKKKS